MMSSFSVGLKLNTSLFLKSILSEKPRILAFSFAFSRLDPLRLYDLLIVDIIMPQINGFDLAEEVKKIDENARVCFLIAGEVPGKLRAN